MDERADALCELGVRFAPERLGQVSDNGLEAGEADADLAQPACSYREPLD